jgi:hypothetical protein
VAGADVVVVDDTEMGVMLDIILLVILLDIMDVGVGNILPLAPVTTKLLLVGTPVDETDIAAALSYVKIRGKQMELE